MPTIDFKKPQQLPIIHFSANQTENSVTTLKNVVVNTDGEKEYRYELSLEIDFILAQRYNSHIFNIKVCKQLPPTNYRGVSNISLSTPENRDWSNVIQIQKIRAQETADSINNTLFIWSKETNLKTYLDVIESSAMAALASAEKIFEEERITLKVLRGGAAKNLGITIEKQDQDTTNNISNFVYGTNNSSQDVNELGLAAKRQDLIYGFLRDPGEFTQKRAATLLTQKFRLGGLISSRGLVGNSFLDLQENPIFISLKKSLNAIVSDGKVEESELGVVEVIEKYKTKNIRVPVVLKETDIGTDDFFFLFEVRDNETNQLAQKISIKVPHSENVKYSTFPIEAPTLNLISGVGDLSAVFSISQNSNNGVFVKIYKAEQTQHVIKKKAAFTLVDTVAVSKTGDETVVIWEDPGYTPGLTTTYRATSVNAYELESAAFASAVLYDPSVKPHGGIELEVAEKPLFCSLYTMFDRNRPEIMLVRVENIPWHVVEITIIRSNITNQEEEEVLVCNGVNVITDQADKVFSFEDTGFFDRNMYEYKIKFWSNDGIYRESTTKHRVVYFYADKESGITNLGVPSVVNGGGPDVSFEIKKEKNLYEADFIQQALTQQGNKEEFQLLLNQNTDRLSPIFQTSIYRTNTDTGEVESFGIVDSDIFIDSKFGPKNGVTRLNNGIKYVYTAITHRRDPETLFYDYTKQITSSITNKSYSYKPAFVNHPVRKREGLIVDEAWINNEPYDLFTFGDVVDIDQTEIIVPSIPPEVTFASARIIAKDKVLVTWEINGDKDLVDHYMVYLNHNGIDTPVGTARSFNADSRYEFVDILDNGEAGVLHYKLIPVYYDYTNGKTISTNQILFFDS